jgi:hypothetical protein
VAATAVGFLQNGFFFLQGYKNSLWTAEASKM